MILSNLAQMPAKGSGTVTSLAQMPAKGPGTVVNLAPPCTNHFQKFSFRMQ